MEQTLLAIDNDLDVYERQRKVWETHGIQLSRVGSMLEAIERLNREDFLIVGINADNVKGYLHHLRALSSATVAPVHVMTTHYSEEENIQALNCGADFFIVWSEDIETSTRRALAMLQRYYNPKRIKERVKILSNGRLSLYPDYKAAFYDGIPLELNSKEYEVLKFLMENKGRILTYEQILHNVWGIDYDDASHNLVWCQVRRLRDKVPNAQEEIKSIKNVGYRLAYI